MSLSNLFQQSPSALYGVYQSHWLHWFLCVKQASNGEHFVPFPQPNQKPATSACDEQFLIPFSPQTNKIVKAGCGGGVWCRSLTKWLNHHHHQDLWVNTSFNVIYYFYCLAYILHLLWFQPHRSNDYTHRIPTGWLNTVDKIDQQWIGQTLFASKGVLVANLKTWWYPPTVPGPNWTTRPSPEAYFYRRFFLWMPRKMWAFDFKCQNLQRFPIVNVKRAVQSSS